MVERMLSKKEQRELFLKTVATIVCTMDGAEEWDVKLVSHMEEMPWSKDDPAWCEAEPTGDITITIELKNVNTEGVRVKA